MLPVVVAVSGFITSRRSVRLYSWIFVKIAVVTDQIDLAYLGVSEPKVQADLLAS